MPPEGALSGVTAGTRNLSAKLAAASKGKQKIKNNERRMGHEFWHRKHVMYTQEDLWEFYGNF